MKILPLKCKIVNKCISYTDFETDHTHIWTHSHTLFQSYAVSCFTSPFVLACIWISHTHITINCAYTCFVTMVSCRYKQTVLVPLYVQQLLISNCESSNSSSLRAWLISAGMLKSQLQSHQRLAYKILPLKCWLFNRCSQQSVTMHENFLLEELGPAQFVKNFSPSKITCYSVM